MYDLIEYINNHAKTSGPFLQYQKCIPNDSIADFETFKFKRKTSGRTPAVGNTKNVEIVLPLKYLSNFWRTLEMLLINCEINLQLPWSANCVITNSTDTRAFAITNTWLYVSVVTLSTQDNAKPQQ